MPTIDDTALWDLHAQLLLDGGVPYRDVMETNPPGTLWLVASIRGLLGASSIALRAADLAIFGAVVLLLLRIMKDAGVGDAVRLGSGVVCLLFYFSVSEWCHCQRDMWLLVPSLGWLWLRSRQVVRMAAPTCSPGRLFGWSVVEGLVLGSGIWIKPMVLVPAMAAWLMGAWWVRQWRPALLDAAGLVLGGLVMGAGGAIWLVACGAWPFFWETFLEWNPRYVAAGREHWTLVRFAGMCLRLFPWLLLHVPAVGITVGALVRGGRPATADRPSGAASPLLGLVAAFYLGWLVQAVALQHLFDYVHAPGVLLAILMCFVGGHKCPNRSRTTRVAWTVFVLVALLCSPTVRCGRLACWARCFRDGSSAEIRDRLRLLSLPDWQALQDVARFLSRRGVRDGELCCFPNSTVHLYAMLDVRPPTKYVFLESYLVLFPARREEILRAIQTANPKYTVTDLIAAGIPPSALPEIGPGTVLEKRRSVGGKQGMACPWEFPIMFRAGRYAVHRTTGSIRSVELVPSQSPRPRLYQAARP